MGYEATELLYLVKEHLHITWSDDETDSTCTSHGLMMRLTTS